MDKTASLGFIGSNMIMLLSFFIAILSPMFNDMVPANPAAQATENLESIILGSGGLVVAGLGFAGSLLQRRGRKFPCILLSSSAIFCFGFASFVFIATESMLLFCFVLIPAILLTVACILSFKPDKSLEGNNSF